MGIVRKTGRGRPATFKTYTDEEADSIIAGMGVSSIWRLSLTVCCVSSRESKT